MLRSAMNGFDDGIAVGNGERTAWAEIILHVGDDEDVLGGDLHKGSLDA
jgi:hypothetical protein